ncbi:hypothetical protein [Sinomonas terrae]|uniref:Uncharacterized protein n=1 Tax=Sinomonas terrae TaxID=2908838 RepID=A0ABS9U714_9MICC|nr:hypothetical protein [Sinomonas terrae]MCH6472493.1 hypothetical protein [Sinomonas terrae]
MPSHTARPQAPVQRHLPGQRLPLVQRLPSARPRPAGPQAFGHQEYLVTALMEAGLSEEQARQQLSRLAAGDVWSG